jgi:hypothetical protein
MVAWRPEAKFNKDIVFDIGLRWQRKDSVWIHPVRYQHTVRKVRGCVARRSTHTRSGRCLWPRIPATVRRVCPSSLPRTVAGSANGPVVPQRDDRRWFTTACTDRALARRLRGLF